MSALEGLTDWRTDSIQSHGRINDKRANGHARGGLPRRARWSGKASWRRRQ